MLAKGLMLLGSAASTRLGPGGDGGGWWSGGGGGGGGVVPVCA